MKRSDIIRQWRIASKVGSVDCDYSAEIGAAVILAAGMEVRQRLADSPRFELDDEEK